MPKVRCDLHIHTALSACASAEMTPKNIVNMALLVEAQVIAITDHNTARNCYAVTKAAGE
ncbi:MAG: PHP domain-containing protein, partial [bacterium]|nr:PHP domain-containing protein [bacterium]